MKIYLATASFLHDSIFPPVANVTGFLPPEFKTYFMARIPIRRLTDAQIQEWQTQELRRSNLLMFHLQASAKFPALNLYDRILRRSLDYYAVEVNHIEAASEGCQNAKDVCTQAKRNCAWDISVMVWSAYN